VKADEDLSPVLMCRVAQRIFYLNPVQAGCRNVVLETLKRKSHDIFLEWMKRILTKLSPDTCIESKDDDNQQMRCNLSVLVRC
jgi:hypothetical protein